MVYVDIRTTQRYTHVVNLPGVNVVSPFDLLSPDIVKDVDN